jgi:hypothetical protein
MAYRLAADVDVGKELEKESDFMFGREFYPLLYEELKQRNTTKHRVVLLGNSGTSKSWFQMYALRRLMLDFNANAEYSFGQGTKFSVSTIWRTPTFSGGYLKMKK